MMLTLFIFIIAVTIWYIQNTVFSGRVSLVFLTFILAFLMDQVKSLFSLGFIYLVVIRKFGFLKENQKEWFNAEQSNIQTELIIPNF